MDIEKIKLEEASKHLSEISDPPKHLYLRGKKPDTSKTFITIVGARKNTSYGQSVCQHLIQGLSKYNVVIVSGLAIGIDSIAHKYALEYGIDTIAVLGSGLDDSVIYPRTNFALAHKILDNGGCLISEQEAKSNPMKHTFLSRNRIMAGLSEITIVVESTKKSGTSVTARLALDYNREVGAVPGSIFSTMSAGPNSLLLEGAVSISNAEDIIKAIGKEEILEFKKIPNDLTDNEKKLIDILTCDMTKSEVIEKTDMPVHTVQITLSILELKGLITERGGKIYRAF